jgi:hypothetical protein
MVPPVRDCTGGKRLSSIESYITGGGFDEDKPLDCDWGEWDCGAFDSGVERSYSASVCADAGEGLTLIYTDDTDDTDKNG